MKGANVVVAGVSGVVTRGKKKKKRKKNRKRAATTTDYLHFLPAPGTRGITGAFLRSRNTHREYSF